MSHVIQDYIGSLHYPLWLVYKTRATHPTNQSDVKLKPVAPWALGSLLNSTLSRLSLAPFYFIFLLIDLCDWSLWFWFYDPSSCNIKKKFISIFSCVLHLKVAVARREEIIKKQDEAIRSLEVINQLVLRSEQLFSLPITGAIQLETSGPKYFRTEHNFITEGKCSELTKIHITEENKASFSCPWFFKTFQRRVFPWRKIFYVLLFFTEKAGREHDERRHVSWCTDW